MTSYTCPLFPPFTFGWKVIDDILVTNGGCGCRAWKIIEGGWRQQKTIRGNMRATEQP
jgi:hypothetical protein